MIEFDTILAKSDPEETLLVHTKNCLQWMENVLKWKSRLIKGICVKYQLEEGLVIRHLFLTVAFHDIGKANIKFVNCLIIRNLILWHLSHLFIITLKVSLF